MNASQSILIGDYEITDKEFLLFQKLIYDKAGITIADTKKGLIQGRLTKRLRHFELSSFHDYYDLVHSENNNMEMQVLIDLLTTNETYFYREQKHFDFINDIITAGKLSSNSLNIWSAACSSGEEPYSLAMLLADKLGIQANWNILATDLNRQILDNALRGLYPITEIEKIPKKYLHAYCLQGTGKYSDYFLIDKSIKEKIDYQQLNLNQNWHIPKSFDLILLRNVMIYFNKKTRQQLVERVANILKPDGYLFISHSETLSRVSDRFKIVQPGVYQFK